MKMLRTVSLVFLGFACVGWAPVAHGQRAGGRPGPAAPAPAHGGLSPAGRPGFAPPAHGGAGAPGRFGGPAGPTVRLYGNTEPKRLFLPPGITSTEPVSYSGGGRHEGGAGHERERGRRNFGLPAYGFVSLAYPGTLNLDPDDFGAPAPQTADTPYERDNQVTAPAIYAGPPVVAGDGAGSSFESTDPEAQTEPPTHSLPRAQPAARASAPPLPEEEAVTIVYKDGRPSEQIHNYALTRSMLYVTAGRVRSIPVDQIDLAATEKINEKAGVEFHLPLVK